MDTRLTSSWYVAAVAVLALAGVLLVWMNTRWGAYLSDDSYYYVRPVRELLAGHGFSPSIAWAPLFPLALAGVSAFGMDVLASARWLNAILFGVNILLAAHIARRMNVPAAFAIIAAALVLLSDTLIEVHGWAMSEALSFTFMLLSLDFALAYIQGGKRRFWWAAAITAALSILTRYAAVPLVMAISLTLFFFGPKRTLGKRALDALLFGIISLLPIGAYWVRNITIAGRPVLYEDFALLPLTVDQVVWFLYHWLSLFIPGRLLRGREILSGVLALTVLAAAGLLVWWMIRKQHIRPDRVYQTTQEKRGFLAGVLLLGSVFGSGVFMLYLARGFSRLDVYNPRYLAPMLLATIILLAVLAGWVWQAGGRVLRLGLAGITALFLVYYAFRAFEFSQMVTQTGLGYSNVGWHNSETVVYLRQRPELTDIISTGDMGIYFWTGRLPRVISSFDSAQAMRQYMCEGDAPFFLMDQMPTELYGFEQEDVTGFLELEQEFNDSKMYRCPATN